MNNGEAYKTKFNGELVILNYINATKVLVVFPDTGYETYSSSSNIRNGLVKDKLRRSVHGVGFIGVGSEKASINRKQTKSYRAWESMLSRCYNAKVIDRNKSYAGCTVCDEWHNFQVFSKWFNDNIDEKIKCPQVDKDIRVKGNKIYSPETCLIVSRDENQNELVSRISSRFEFIDSNGGVLSGSNLSALARSLDLDPSTLSKLNRGVISSYKGITKASN